MAHHDERATLAHRGDQLVENVHGMGVEPRVGLVEQHYRRVVHERPGDGDALGHAARERAHPIEPAMFEPHGIEKLYHAVLRVGHAVELRVQKQVLLGGEVGVEHRVVRDEPDGLAHALGLLLHVDARERHRSLRGPRQRGEHAQKRGLARAVGPEHREERALRQRERHVVDGLAAAERLRQVIDGKRRFHGTTPPPSRRR